MKKALLCLVCMLTVLIGKAQTPDTTTHYGLMNYVFANVNKTPISTGILREYGIDFADLSQYNGTALTDTNWVTLPDLRRVYNTLYSGQISTAANLIGLDSVNTIISTYASTSKPITFACLNYNYNYLDSNSVAHQLLTVTNNQLFDVAGRTQSPYLQATAFAIAPTQQGILTGNNQLIFRPQLFFSNTGKTVSSIQIDPTGTGSYQTVAFNTPITVNYATTGSYTVNFIITYNDGSKRYAHTKLIAYPNPTSNPSAATRALASPAGTGGTTGYIGNSTPKTFTAQNAYMGVKGTGDYTIELSANNTSGLLKKPLIVIEGFDPIENPNDYPYTGNTYADLIANYSNDPNNNSYITLSSGLDNTDSFDIVYLHWKNSTDYIERNAYLLESLIQVVNNMKTAAGSTEKNVIIGMSMGGLVARWALRDMEMNNIDHQTRLFISHDAPHWGANVPVAFQAMIQYLAPWQQLSVGFKPLQVNYNSMFPEAQQGLTIFNSPAARQMLIQRYILSGTTLTAENSMHTSFMTELNSMGWPQNCRNITLSNGTGTGAPLFSDNSKLLSLSGQVDWSYGGQLWRSLVASVVGVPGISPILIPNVPVNNTSLLVQFPLSLVSTKTALGINMGAWAVPKTGSATLFSMDLYLKRKILWIANSTTHIIKSTVTSIPGMLPLDNAPGGTYNLSDFGLNINDINDDLATGFFSFARASLIQPSFCFVPTVSALNINNPAQNLFTAMNSNTVPCLLPPHVSDYHTAPQTNQEHTSYTQDNTDWLMTELPAGYINTAVCPSNYQVLGPTSTCSLSNTYSVANLPATGTVTWSVSPAGIVTLTPNADNTVTVNKTSTGNITLTALISITGASPFSNTTNVLVGGCVIVKNSGSGVIRGGVTFVNSAGQQTAGNFGAALNSTTLVLLPGQYTLNVNMAPGSGPVLIQENGINHQIPGATTTSIGPLSVADGYTVLGYSPYYTNVAQSRTFTRNNCSSGMLGTAVVYTVPASTYFSALSQQDADGQATNDINTNGQTYSNVHGSCTTPSVVMQNNSDGRIMIQFDQGSTIVYSTIVIAGNTTTVTTIPPGTYTVKMQNAGTGSSHVFAVSGYSSQTGTTATFNGVNVGTSVLNISITNASLNANSLVLYPNPANSSITIQSVSNSKTQAATQTTQVNKMASTALTEAAPAILKVNVYDKTGNVQLTQNFGKNSNTAQLDISKLINGVYFVEITTANGTEIHELIITH